MQHKSTPPPRQGPGGGITKRANASLSIYPSAKEIASASFVNSPAPRNDNRPGAIPTPLLRAAISWLYVAGFISEAAHDAAWKKLEGL
jgi:hypothetical protein